MRKLVLILVVLLGVYALACEFQFEPSSYTGKLGETFVLAVTVVKTHRRCVISMDDYKFDFKNVQVLGLTGWKQISSNTYQKKFLLSFSKVGEGYVKISKNCSREGYQEKIMKVMVKESKDLLEKIEKKIIPFDTKLEVKKEDLKLEKLVFKDKEKKYLTIDSVKLGERVYKLPFKVEVPTNVEIYALYSENLKYPLLIASKDFIYRFDVYMVK